MPLNKETKPKLNKTAYTIPISFFELCENLIEIIKSFYSNKMIQRKTVYKLKKNVIFLILSFHVCNLKFVIMNITNPAYGTYIQTK